MRRLSFLFALLLLSVTGCGNLFAQELTWDFLSYRGKTARFEMGTFPNGRLPETAVRIDSSLYRILAAPQLTFNPAQVFPDLRYAAVPSRNVRIDSSGLGGGAIDIDYRSRNVKTGRLLALGNVQLRPGAAQRVKYIELDLARGRIADFSAYRNVRVIAQLPVELDSRRKPVFEHPEVFAPMFYPGDLFFWQDLRSCRKLEMLAIVQDVNYFSDRNTGNLFFIDESVAELLEGEKLRTLQLQGVSYLPVNFRAYEKLGHLVLQNVPVPEMVNLAIVLNSFGKDTSGNWDDFLSAAQEQTIVLPANGLFETHYKNGRLLCRGNYANDLPDGAWDFYYDNGRLCETRFYANGQKTGTWLLLAPEGDTLTIFAYRDNRLVYRRDLEQDTDHPCSSLEFSYEVRKISEYRLDWKSDRAVSVSRTLSSIVLPGYPEHFPVGDTLIASHENWNFANGEWEYSWTYTCIDEEWQTAILRRNGKIGESAYRAQRIDKNEPIGGYRPPYYIYRSITEKTVDLRGEFSEETIFTDDNPEKTMKPGKMVRKPFGKEAYFVE